MLHDTDIEKCKYVKHLLHKYVCSCTLKEQRLLVNDMPTALVVPPHVNVIAAFILKR